MDACKFAVAECHSVQGLDTPAPELRLAKGVICKGEYDESIGSLMFFTPKDTGSATQPGSLSDNREAERPSGLADTTPGEVQFVHVHVRIWVSYAI